MPSILEHFFALGFEVLELYFFSAAIRYVLEFDAPYPFHCPKGKSPGDKSGEIGVQLYGSYFPIEELVKITLKEHELDDL